MFTTSTIFASFLLFRGFNTQGTAPAISLLCGFVVIFLGVYLLNMNRLIDPVTQEPRMSLVTGEGVPAGRASEQYPRPGSADPLGLPSHRTGAGHMQRASWHGRIPSSRPPPYAPHRQHSRRESETSTVIFEDGEEAGFGQPGDSVGLQTMHRTPPKNAYTAASSPRDVFAIVENEDDADADEPSNDAPLVQRSSHAAVPQDPSRVNLLSHMDE